MGSERNDRFKRRQTLHRIQITKLQEKIKLEKSAYIQMDEAALRLYGIGNSRILLIVRLLRKRFYVNIQAFLSFLYIILVIGAFIAHDVWFQDISEQTVANNSNETSVMDGTRSLLITESVLLLIFILDLTLNTYGYGCLYLQHLAGIELFLIFANAGLIFALA